MINAQLNPTVGDLENNRHKIEEVWNTHNDVVDLILCPEMMLTGYPLEDLVLRESFINDVCAHIADLKTLSKAHKAAILVGAPWRKDGLLYNAVHLFDQGSHLSLIHI